MNTPFIIEENVSIDGWRFNQIAESGLSEVSWILHSGTIDLAGIEGYTLENGERNYNIAIADTKITPQREVLEGIIAEDFFLNAGGNLFEVKQALVRGNKIIILNAILHFIDGFTTGEITVENFSIDTEGNLEKEPGFNTSEFHFYWNGFYISVTGLDFIGNSLVIQQGTIAIGDMILSISGGELVFEGLSDSLDIHIGELTIWLYGFKVTSESALLTSEGILLPAASIYLPELFGGGTRNLSGLLFDLNGLTSTNGTILEPGTGNIPFTISATGYGKDVVVEELLLNNDGFFASRITTALPDCTGGNEISFSMLPLLSNPAFGISQPKENGVPFTLAGFNVTGQAGTFNSEEILFPVLDVQLPSGCIPEIAGFENLKLNGGGVTEPAVFPGYIGFEKDGWYFDLENMSLDSNECKGTAHLILPDAFGGRTILFNNFVLFPDGTYGTGPAEGEHYFRLHGWKVLGSGLSLDGNTIQCEQGKVRLYSVMGYEILAIPNIVLDAGGNLVSCGNGTETIQFLSTNAFRTSATKYMFTQDGLYLCGQVFFPPALGDNVAAGFSNYEIKLEYDGTVITPEIPGPIIYKIADWDVSAEDITFDREGLSIKSNKLVVFKNIIVSIPHLRYYPDGSIKVGGAAFEGFVHSLGGFTLGVTDISLSEQGLNIKSFISLPEFFGGFSVYFDRLTLHPNGSISTDVVVPEFDFKLGEFHFLFKNIGFSDEGFAIEQGTITLPSNFDSKQVRINNFAIKSDGSFDLGGINVDPFSLWGYVFHLKNIGFHQGVVSFEGSIQFPKNFFLQGLAGMTIEIKTFEIMLDGTLVDFKVRVDEEFSFEILDAFTIVVDTISVNKNILIIEEARLELPPEIAINTVSVQGIQVDVKTREIDYGTINITGVPIEFMGCYFYLENLAISAERGLEFKGNVTLPYDLPVLSSAVLTVDMFQITPDLEVGDITASISGITTSIFDFFELKNGTIGMTKTSTIFELSCSGELEFGWNFPEGIRGTTLNLYEFTINADGTITSFNAELEDLFSFDLFGITTVEVSSFSMILDDVENVIVGNISGNLILSDLFPGGLKGKPVEILTFRFDTTGDITEFSAQFDLTGQDVDLFVGMVLRDGVLLANLVDNEVIFDVSGSLVFSENFPVDMGTTTIDFTSMKFDSNGNIIDCQIDTNISNLSLFGTITIVSGTININHTGTGAVDIGITGLLKLSDVFPEGLAGQYLTLEEFNFSSDGTIYNFHAYTSLSGVRHIYMCGMRTEGDISAVVLQQA